ncbi:MAG: hypothetical protein EOP14_02645 [Pseudomonas sp.]|nr:MAG: hypothetical protein EOP14_02645 [Pseudomonas sp.]
MVAAIKAAFPISSAPAVLPAARKWSPLNLNFRFERIAIDSSKVDVAFEAMKPVSRRVIA